ncbi:hypothetical protein CFC21_109505 [Triticum aestivum]|uniref:RING-type E3 ubiquitin transferase n=3 Tax=Triticinae TaxID=1648030 RepID=A0A9R1ML45_WHEAT|nr:hypothetical protein CFC21_109505 [Triticum aestivum]
MVWPSPLKFISELGADARALLEAALVEANREREKKIVKGTKYSDSSPTLSDAGAGDDDDVDDQEDKEVCSICFEQACSIEVEDRGNRMCAACTLVLCCHSKPNPATLQPPACPFCRSCISRLVVVDSKAKAVAVAGAGDEADEKPASPRLSRRRSRTRSREGSSNFKGLSSAMGSLSSKIERGSGRLVGDGDGAFLDKLEHDLP